jgi:hypothetical protein
VAFARHTEAVDLIQGVVRGVSTTSGLLLETDASNYMLLELAVERSLPLAEAVALLRGMGAGLLSSQNTTQADLLTIAKLNGQLIAALKGAKRSVDSLAGHSTENTASWQSAIDNCAAFAELVQQTFKEAPVSGDAKAYFD